MDTKTTITTILPPMTAVGKRRLRKLIGHLKTMPRKRFDFTTILTKRPRCGTTGCAIGETPKLFPRLVKVVPVADTFNAFSVVPRAYEGDDAYQCDSVPLVAKHLFGIEEYESMIFAPECQEDVHYSLPVCGDNATPKQVARLLERYITLTETEVAP